MRQVDIIIVPMTRIIKCIKIICNVCFGNHKCIILFYFVQYASCVTLKKNIYATIFKSHENNHIT